MAEIGDPRPRPPDGSSEYRHRRRVESVECVCSGALHRGGEHLTRRPAYPEKAARLRSSQMIIDQNITISGTGAFSGASRAPRNPCEAPMLGRCGGARPAGAPNRRRGPAPARPLRQRWALVIGHPCPHPSLCRGMLPAVHHDPQEAYSGKEGAIGGRLRRGRDLVVVAEPAGAAAVACEAHLGLGPHSPRA